MNYKCPKCNTITNKKLWDEGTFDNKQVAICPECDEYIDLSLLKES